MQVKELLERARARITPAASWTQKTSARNAAGQAAPVWSVEAVCWCSTGAIRRELNDEGVFRATLEIQAINMLRKANENKIYFLSDFNDTHTHEEVLQAFDRAIEYASSH